MNYPIHDELKAFSGFTMPKAAISTKGSVLYNALSGLTTSVVRPQKGILMENYTIEGHEAGVVDVRMYTPSGMKEPSPALLYIHGGGFLHRASVMYHAISWRYAVGAQCKVVFVDYRTAEEYPFPTSLEDCFCSWKWLTKRAPVLGIDPQRIAIAGDSAGGALAAGVTHLVKERGGIMPSFQLLVYPVTDQSQSTKSMREFVDTPAWNSELNALMWENYLRHGDFDRLHHASPLMNHDFSNLPPAYIEVAEFDCLRDEGIAYGEKLMASGVETQSVLIQGAFHGFDRFFHTELVKKVFEDRYKALSSAFKNYTTYVMEERDGPK
jgi:acetyl esterase